MTSRADKRKIINRKSLDYTCPVDKLVVGVLHTHAHANNLEAEVVAADTCLDTLKLIRKDVFKSHPDILEQDNVVEAELVEE